MHSFFLLSSLALSVLSAPAPQTLQDLHTFTNEQQDEALKVVPTIANVQLEGAGCKDAVIDFTSTSSTIAFPNFKEQPGQCVACVILLELEGTESTDFHGLDLDLHGKISLGEEEAVSYVFLRPLNHHLSGRKYQLSADEEKVIDKDFYISKVVKEDVKKIEFFVCANPGGQASIEEIKIGFVEY
jgi:hypothetical protein